MTLIRYTFTLLAATLLGAGGLFVLRGRRTDRKELLRCLYGGFVFALVLQLLKPAPDWQPGDWADRGMDAVNLRPLHTLRLFWRAGGLAALINLAGNLVLFLPLGALPPLLWGRCRKLFYGLLPGFALSLTAECAQYFLGRSVDVDDLLLNTLGAAIGWLLWFFYDKNRCTD